MVGASQQVWDSLSRQSTNHTCGDEQSFAMASDPSGISKGLKQAMCLALQL